MAEAEICFDFFKKVALRKFQYFVVLKGKVLPNAHFDSPKRNAESTVLPRILDEFYHRARLHKWPPARKHWKSSSEKNATLRETEPTWLEELQNMERVSLDKFQAKKF